MEAIVFLVILAIVFSFGGQLIQGISNIFSIFGRIGGWILGIILFIFFIKMILFG